MNGFNLEDVKNKCVVTMKKKTKKKNQQKKQIIENRGSSLSINSSWEKLKSNPINKLLLKFFTLMIVFYIFWATPFIQENIILPISCLYAYLAGSFLNIFGYSVNILNDTVGNSNFSISIKNGCDGVEGLAIFLCAILIYPATISQKAKGVLIGFSFLILLNLIRVISLFLTGVHLPGIFDLMHESIWQIAFILLTLFALLKWVGWVSGEK